MHKSVRAIIEQNGKIMLIHRVKQREDGTFREYFVIPGGKMELGETEEQTVEREVFEELGIKIMPKRKILEYYSDYDDSIQIFWKCEYLEGNFGTGNGPEIMNKEDYKGIFEPIMIEKEKIKNINLVPEEIKEKFIQGEI